MKVQIGELIECGICNNLIEPGKQYAKLTDLWPAIYGYPLSLIICKSCIDKINKSYDEHPAIKLEDTNGHALVF